MMMWSLRCWCCGCFVVVVRCSFVVNVIVDVVVALWLRLLWYWCCYVVVVVVFVVVCGGGGGGDVAGGMPSPGPVATGVWGRGDGRMFQ